MRAKVLLLSAPLALAAGTAAQNSPPPIPVELRARFGFLGPRIAKIGDGIGNLQIADVDGDGRLEAVVSDGRRARLVVVRIDGDGTSTEPIPTDGQIAGYAVADIDGDGKRELLMVDSRGRLQIRDRSGARERQPIDLGMAGRGGVGLLTGDLDGDGRADLLAVSRGVMRRITRLAEQPELSPIEPIEENAHSFELGDVDGDGRLDILFVAPGPSMNLRLRRGRGDGSFGPWLMGHVDNLRTVFLSRLGQGQPAIATVEGPNRRVALHRFADHGGQAALEWWALAESAGARYVPFALGDFDGDGDPDLVVAQPERAQLLLFEWRNGTFSMRAVPSLAGTTSLDAGDVDGDGRLDLVLTSAEEDVLAWKSGAEPFDQFPRQLPCVDKPVAAAVAPDGGIIVLGRTERREAHLHRIVPGADAPSRLCDLGRLPADPTRLLIADVGEAPGFEVAFVVPGEGLRVVNPALEVERKGQKGGGEPAGFTKKMEDGSLVLTEHEGRPALLVVRDRFLRRFRVDGQGQVQVLAQDNGPQGMVELSLAAPLGDDVRLYLDKKNNKLVRARVGEPATSLDMPPIDFTHLVAHGSAALLIGPRGVLRVPFGNGPSLRSELVHEPPTDRTHYWLGKTGDFDRDGSADLALLDGSLPGVQILTRSGDGLLRCLAMPAFETPPGEGPNNEPREMAVGDLNGDGRDDLVLIAHDRLLIYLQQP